MTTINVGDTVRHNTRPDVHGTVTNVKTVAAGGKPGGRTAVYLAGHKGGWKPDHLTVTPNVRVGDTVRHDVLRHVHGVVTNVTTGIGGRTVAYVTGYRGAYSPDLLTVEQPPVDTAAQLAAVDSLAALPLDEAPVKEPRDVFADATATHVGWWDLDPDGNADNQVRAVRTLGLQVRVQVRRAP